MLASCGYQKMRFSKVQKKTQEVVKVDDARKELRASVKSQRKPKPEQVEVITENVAEDTRTEVNDEVTSEVERMSSDKETTINGAQEKQLPPDDEKAAEALEAEKNASRGMWLLIAALPGAFLILPGLILIIIGAIYSRKARNAQYITKKGQDRLKIGRVFLVLASIICFLFIFGIVMLYVG